MYDPYHIVLYVKLISLSVLNKYSKASLFAKRHLWLRLCGLFLCIYCFYWPQTQVCPHWSTGSHIEAGVHCPHSKEQQNDQSVIAIHFLNFKTMPFIAQSDLIKIKMQLYLYVN